MPLARTLRDKEMTVNIPTLENKIQHARSIKRVTNCLKWLFVCLASVVLVNFYSLHLFIKVNEWVLISFLFKIKLFLLKIISLIFGLDLVQFGYYYSYLNFHWLSHCHICCDRCVEWRESVDPNADAESDGLKVSLYYSQAKYKQKQRREWLS